MNNLLAQGFDINNLTNAVNRETGARNFTNIGQLLNGSLGGFGIVTLIFFIAGVMFLLNVVRGGLTLMSSDGDPKKVGEARDTIYNSFIGILLVLFSYWIVQIVGMLLALPDFQTLF